jgi:hypothetical protein
MRDILALKHYLFGAACVDPKFNVKTRRDSRNFVLCRRHLSEAPGSQPNQPVKSTTIQQVPAQRLGDATRYRTLAGAARAIDSQNRRF